MFIVVKLLKNLFSNATVSDVTRPSFFLAARQVFFI